LKDQLRHKPTAVNIMQYFSKLRWTECNRRKDSFTVNLKKRHERKCDYC